MEVFEIIDKINHDCLFDERITIEINEEHDIKSARHEARQAARKLGFSLFDQSRIITLISELARNIYKYAGCGRIYLKPINQPGSYGLTILAIDQGPGIADIEKAMKQGYSTSGSLGAGLPAIKRMADEFTIDSIAGKGTCVKVIKWLG